MMRYFLRTEETPEDAEDALRRGRSLQRWSFAGHSLEDHVRFDFSWEEKVDAVRTALAVRDEDMSDWFEEDEYGEIPEPEDLRDYELADLFDDLCDEEHEEEIAEALGFERYGKGWARFHEGLDAIDGWDHIPSQEEVEEAVERFVETAEGAFEYLVLFEGEHVGWDTPADEGPWPLFKPERIVWVKKTVDLVPGVEITERMMY